MMPDPRAGQRITRKTATDPRETDREKPREKPRENRKIYKNYSKTRPIIS